MFRIVFVACVLVGCSKPNPEFCCESEAQCAEFGGMDIQPCGVGQTCTVGATCVAIECETTAECTDPAEPICINELCEARCELDEQCPQTTPYCDAGTCIACRDSNDCGETTPICDEESRACRGCSKDIECDTGVCIEAEARCEVDANVSFLSSSTGAAGAPCTRAEPCSSFGEALAKVTPARNVIHLLGGGTATLGMQTVNIGAKTVIVDGTETIVVFGGAGSKLVVPSSGSLLLENLRLTFQSTAALEVQDFGTAKLYDVDVELSSDMIEGQLHTDGGAISAHDTRMKYGNIGTTNAKLVCSNGGSVELVESKLERIGVSTTTCRSTVSRTIVDGGRDTSLRLQDGIAIVENSLVLQSYELADSVNISGAGSSFRFNTIVNTSTVVSDGVAFGCNGADVTSNVFAYNSTNPISGGCTIRSSLFDESGAADAGANATQPFSAMFVDFANRDFHLPPSSPSANQGEAGIVDVDLNGATRSATPDVGAFESP